MIAISMLHPPAARPGGVHRQGLLDRLTESLAVELVLVVAPAGWGKTSLLRDWWLAADRSRRAWLSLEKAHNDPMRFWSSIIAAIGTAVPGGGAAALEVLTASAVKTPGYVEPLLIDVATRLPERVTLVLDDFHLITNQDVLAGFEFLVEHLPPTLGLVVAARSDPALPLARLRARGEMAEIRAGDLAFSEEEAAQLLGGTLGLTLTAEQVHTLWQRTEGWAAGLYLAGLALRGLKDDDLAGFIRGFAGDDRHVFDYLATEVLAGLPARVRSFLLRTSVLDRFCGPLCDAVTGAGCSQGLLEEIEQAQLFVVPLDNVRDWYRYHVLFAEMLRRELDRSEPGLAPLLHRRASAWYRQHGPVTEAIGHAIAAGDLAEARDLIAAHWDDLLCEGLADTLQSWLDELPPQMVVEDARMCLIRGMLALSWGPLGEAPAWLAAAEAAAPMGPFRQGPSSIESGISFLRAGYHHLTGDLAGAETAIRRALELEESGSGRWRDPVLGALGMVLFWRGLDAEASSLLEPIIHLAHQPATNHARLLALGCLAAIAAWRGDRETAERHLREAADLAARHRLRGSWETVTADLTRAGLLADHGEPAAAEALALEALDHARRGQARLETAAALLCLARIYLRAGRLDDARARISQARDLLAKCPDPGILTDLLAEAEHQAVPPVSVPAPRAPGDLTAREAEVLGLLAEGYTNLEIAAKLVVSVHTVERHLQNAYRKIGVHSRAHAAAYMARTGG
jgi:LuxR family transcriptional regulator, maltose regulon positive regulatory protein